MDKYNNILTIMVCIRLFSGLMEITAAGFMHYFKSIEIAIRINAILGFFGPLILVLVTFLGLTGLSSTLSIRQIIFIATGVALIIIGTK